MKYTFPSHVHIDTNTFWGKNKQEKVVYTHNTECIYFSSIHTYMIISIITIIYLFLHAYGTLYTLTCIFPMSFIKKITNNNTITHFIAEALGP